MIPVSSSTVETHIEFEPDIGVDIPVEIQRVEFTQETPNDVTLKLGGTLTLESQVGIGTRFVIRMPIAVVSGSPLFETV